MAFDAGMVAAVADECNRTLAQSRVEKIMQPSGDEVIFLLHSHTARRDIRLLVSASAAHPRVHITSVNVENPAVPPMFCMLLRKYLLGSRLMSVEQCGFERVIKLTFEACDPLGYTEGICIYAEIMGKYSNIILCDAENKILGACRPVDFSTSQKRQILPGMTYELPPAQDKLNPLEITPEQFSRLIASDNDSDTDTRGWEKIITSRIAGFSRLSAAELVFRSCGSPRKLRDEFARFVERIKNADFKPTLIRESAPDAAMTASMPGMREGRMIEYCFMPVGQYGTSAVVSHPETFGELLDRFFTTKEQTERMRQRASDILRLLTGADTRLRKKIAAQKLDLAECEKKEELRQAGDLITANIYQLKRGDTEVELVDYYSEDLRTVKLTLDPRLTPSQNAQRYYKKYAKAKSAEVALAQQLEIAESELEYIGTVFDALTRAGRESDLDDIRAELYESGFASRMKNYERRKNLPKSKPDEYRTDGGFTVFCGRNNTQNDLLTFRLAEKGDWWFHVKGQPGSHVIMLAADNAEEPSELDFTQAAVIAATMSKAADGINVAVDYTKVKNIKKPPASKPGYVTYSTNWTAYVDPDADLVERLRVSKK